jgi:hypothetical protein
MRSIRGRCVVAAAALSLAAGMAPSAPAAGVRTFHDSVGEIAGAPDIGKVTVTQDNETLDVQADVANLPLLSKGTALFALNTDGDTTTGDFGGADYLLLFDLKTWAGGVERWNGTRYVGAKKVHDPSRTLIGGKSIGFMFDLANFAWPKRISLSMIVVRGAVEDGLVDHAPNSGAWAFDVRPALETLDLGFAPTRPHAGAVFGYSDRSARIGLSDKTTAVPRTLSCTARLAGAQLVGLGRRDSCRWQVPKGSTGKLLTIDATVSYAGTQVEFGTWKFRVA